MPESRLTFSQLLGPKTNWILEVGSYHGLSTRLMLEAAPHASVVCVDTWQDQPRFGHFHQFETFIASCWQYRHRIVALKGDSRVLLPQLVEARFRPDLVYVDGDHEMPVVAEDVFNALRFPGARVIGDDYDFREFPAVVGAVHAVALRQEPAREVRNNGRCWDLGVNP